MLYVFYENFSRTHSIQYFTFSNGSTSGARTIADVTPTGDNNASKTCGGPALDTQAWDQSHLARTNEVPSATVDGNGNIDVTWDGRPPSSRGTGPSVVYVAILANGRGTPYVQALPDKTSSAGELLTQWQPSIAHAGGSHGVAVGYFQVVQLRNGSYQIERDQVTAAESTRLSFKPAQTISTVSWKPPPTTTVPTAGSCYEGDYSSAASEANANVIWSYWSDSRNKDPDGHPEQDIYGLFTSVP